MKNKPYWSDGLSRRVEICLNNCDIFSRKEALEAYKSGRLHPLKYPPRYGWVSHKELAKWLKLPEPQKPFYVPKKCPHCGRNIK